MVGGTAVLPALWGPLSPRGLGWEAQLPTPGANPRPASATAASPFQLTQAKQPLNPLRNATAVPRARAARGRLGAGPGAWGGARVSNPSRLAGAGTSDPPHRDWPEGGASGRKPGWATSSGSE